MLKIMKHIDFISNQNELLFTLKKITGIQRSQHRRNLD